MTSKIYNLGPARILLNHASIDAPEALGTKKPKTMTVGIMRKISFPVSGNFYLFLTRDGNQVLIPVDRFVRPRTMIGKVTLRKDGGKISISGSDADKTVNGALRAEQNMSLVIDITNDVEVRFLGELSNLHLKCQGNPSHYKLERNVTKGEHKDSHLFVRKGTHRKSDVFFSSLHDAGKKPTYPNDGILSEDKIFDVSFQDNNTRLVNTDKHVALSNCPRVIYYTEMPF